MKQRQPQLKHVQIIRLSRILNMMYKPSELAEEIGVTSDTIYRSYLPAGLPHIRDHGNVWIYGPAFVGWAKETIVKKKNRRIPLAENMAWCMKCNQAVRMISPRIKYASHSIEILQSKCPLCNTTINRARARQKEGMPS